MSSTHFPIRTASGPRNLNKAITGFNTTAPNATSFGAAKAQAHGVCGMEGKVSFALDTGKTVTIWIYQEVAKKWLALGSTVVAAANTLYGVDAPEKALFYLTVDATTANGWVYDLDFTS